MKVDCVLRVEGLNPVPVEVDPHCERHQVEHRQSAGHHLQVGGGEPGGDQQHREEPDGGSEGDELDQVVVDGNHAQQDRPRDQQEDERDSRPRPHPCGAPRLTDEEPEVQPEKGGIEHERGVNAQVVSPDHAAEISDRKQRDEPPPERPGGGQEDSGERDQREDGVCSLTPVALTAFGWGRDVFQGFPGIGHLERSVFESVIILSDFCFFSCGSLK